MTPFPLIYLFFVAMIATDAAMPAVRGHVVRKDDGAAVPGAAIEDEQGKVLAVAAGDGTFELRLPPVPREFLTARAHGFAVTRVPLPPVRGRVTLPPIELSRGATLTVTLSGEAAGVRRVVLQHSGEKEDERTERDVPRDPRQTETVFHDVPPGAYRVVARGDGPLEAAGVHVRLRPAEEAKVAVPIDPFLLDLRVTHGKRAVAGANVAFERNETGAVGTVTTGSEGAVSARLFQRGEWFLVTDARELRQAHLSAAALDGDERQAWTVSIPAKTIRGTVRDKASGRPLEGVAVDVTFQTLEDGQPVSGTYGAATDASGAYELTGAREGRYLLAFRHDDYRPAGPLDFRMEEWDDAVERNAVLERRSQDIRLRVVDAGGAPLPRTAVIVTPLPAHPTAARTYRTDGEGGVALDTIQGPVVVFAVPADASFGMMHLDPARIGGETIELRVPRPAANVALRVMTSEGMPLERLRTIVRWDGWMMPPTVLRLLEAQPGNQLFTGSDGRLLFRGIPTGMYEIWPYHALQEAEDIVLAGGNAPISLHVPPGDTRVTVTVDRR